MSEQVKKDYSVLPSLKGLRLLFVGYYPPPFGGIASHLKALMPALIEAGAEDIAVVMFDKKNTIEKLDGVTLYRFNNRSNVWKLILPQNVFLLLKVFRRLGGRGLSFLFLVREAVKSVLINSVAKTHQSAVVSAYHSFSNIQMLPLNDYWMRRKPILLTVYGEIYEPGLERFMIQHRELIKELLGIAKSVMSSSRHCARSFAKLDIHSQIEVVFVGVEVGDVISQEKRNGFREKHNIKSDEVLVFFMGRMIKEMGLDVVLDTAEVLLASEPKARLLIAGATGDLSPLSHALVKQYPDRVLAFENVSFQQQRDLYSAADILVAPSFNQRACMGVSIKEAMAARLPVVAGAGGGIPEAVVHGETGFLVPLGASGSVDMEKYVEAVRKLVGDPELRRRFGNAGRQRAVELFSVGVTNHRVAEIIQAAANSPR